MASCKIMRRNFAMKIGSSKEVYSAKDKKVSLGSDKVSFLHKQSIFAGNSNKSSPKKDKTTLARCRNDMLPNHYWNNLAQSEVALKREENKGPLRAIRSAFYNRPTIIPTASSGKLSTKDSFTNTIKRVFGPCKAESTDDELIHRSAVATLAANRRLLKSSTGLKIFPSRRFGSSASSSCCSLFRRHDDRGRATSFKRALRSGFMDRAYNTQTATGGDANGNPNISNISSSRYLESLRNQNMSATLGSVSQAVQLSSKIQEELMPVDKSLRERISIKFKHINQKQPDPKDTDPMCGWHHPPSPDTLSNRQAERRSVSSYADKLQQDPARVRQPNIRKRRLDMQCKPLPEAACTSSGSSGGTTTAQYCPANASMSMKKGNTSLSQQAPSSLPNCDSVVTEAVSPRQTTLLTARRLTNVDQQPKRRFSLKRPPKTMLPEITAPARGPAAESLLQIQSKINSPSPRSYTTRLIRLNSRAF